MQVIYIFGDAMRNSAKKKVCALFFLFVILFFVGCGNTSNDSITITITERTTLSHIEQPPTITTQEIRAGDTITLEDWRREWGTITLIEIRDDSVILQFEGFSGFELFSPNIAYGQVEIEYGEEHELMTPTLSTWTIWTLVFE